MLTRPSQWDSSFYDSDDDMGYPSSSVFDGPQYYPPYGSIKINLPRGSIRLSHGHLLSIFPGLSARLGYNGTLDGYKLVSEVGRRLTKSRGIDYTRISYGLSHVFRAVQESEQGYNDFRHLINGVLRGALDRDGPYQSYNRGLVRSRSLFAIFATLAKFMMSQALASALAHFLHSHQSKIMACEHEKHIASWGLSFMDIESMVHPMEATNCFRALAHRLEDIRDSLRWRRYYDQRLFRLVQILESFVGDWGFRGRRPIRPLLCDMPRANTMPAPILHRPPPLMLPPPMPLVPYTPSPPMDVALPAPYVNPALEEQVDILSMEVDNLGSHQADLHDGQLQLADNQMDLREGQMHLDHRVNHMEHNQRHVNEDLYNKIEDLAQQRMSY